MSKLSLSYHATFIVLMPLTLKRKGLSGSRRALHSRNQSPFQIFALVREKLRLLWKDCVSVPLQRERERETGTERLK